jgi:hypothetical protein
LDHFSWPNAADFIVLDLAATPVIKRRLEQVEPTDEEGKPRTRWSIWHEKLFVLMTLGDDRVVKATYIMGEQVYDRDLPPGVVKLNDGEKCPPRTLCLYRDRHCQSPVYGIRAGYDVDLSKLNMGKAVSSWFNGTQSPALLIGYSYSAPLEPRLLPRDREHRGKGRMGTVIQEQSGVGRRVGKNRVTSRKRGCCCWS